MAKYRIKTPKGTGFVVEAPDDATPEQIQEAFSQQHGQQVWQDQVIQQELSEQRRAFQEETQARKSYASQDAILGDIEEKKKQKLSGNLEAEIRALRKQEQDIAKSMEGARTISDIAAWKKSAESTEPLFRKRTDLFDRLRKTDPKKADALFDELYLRQ